MENIDYTKTTSFENNSSINTEMITNALNNIVNDCQNNVMQTNMVELSAIASASNTLNVQYTNAKNIIINDVDMKNGADANIETERSQTVVNNISESIESNITNKINNEINDNNIINKQNIKELQESVDELPTIQGIQKPNIANIVNNMIGLKTSKDANVSIKRMLNIDNTLETNVTNNITNNIQNTVIQTNFASCAGVALATNKIDIYDTTLTNNLIIDNINMKARADVNIKCLFTQENISKISNTIITNISTNINNLYAEVKKEPTQDPKKHKFLHLLSKTIGNKIKIAGTLNNAPLTQIQSTTSQSTTPQSTTPLTQIQSTVPPLIKIPESEPVKQSFFDVNKYFIFGGVIILLIIVIIIIIIN